MNIRLATLADKEAWDEFVSQQATVSFLQSWAWGQMQQELGVTFWRYLVEEDGIAAVALVIRRDLPFRQSWLYAPRGPILREEKSKEAWLLLQQEWRRLAGEQKALFIRIDPAWINDMASPLAGQTSWLKAEREVQPRHTLLLDITEPEEKILEQMHSKTRYNINLAQRRGVTVRFSQDEKDLRIFFDLALELMRRTNFHYHTSEYYEAMLSALARDNMIDIAIAEYQGRPLAANLMISYGGTTTYAHGASSVRERQVMAPYLLHWLSIQRAKQQGNKLYDFFGIAPQGASPQHSWAGITRFKTGFGGKQVEYIGAQDLVIDAPRYTLFNVARRWRGAAR